MEHIEEHQSICSCSEVNDRVWGALSGETAVSCCVEDFMFKSLCFFLTSHLSTCLCCVQLCLMWLCIWALQCYIYILFVYVYIFFPNENYGCFSVTFCSYWPPHDDLAFVLMLEKYWWKNYLFEHQVLILFLLKISSCSCEPTMLSWIIPPFPSSLRFRSHMGLFKAFAYDLVFQCDRLAYTTVIFHRYLFWFRQRRRTLDKRRCCSGLLVESGARGKEETNASIKIAFDTQSVRKL